MSTYRERVKGWHQKFVVEVRSVSPETRRKLYTAAFILMGVGVTLFAAMLFQVLTQTGIAHQDHAINNWIDGHRKPYLTPVMIVLAEAFGPVLLPIILAIAIFVWVAKAKHAWRPFALGAFMVFGVIIVEIIAHSVGRMRPPLGMMLLGPDHTASFPSGHVMATADFLLISSYLLISRRPTRRLITFCAVVIVLVVGLQIVSRMYLGYHWLSDTLGSVSLALFMLGLVIAVDTWRTVRVPGETEKLQGKYSKRQTEGT